MEQTTPAGVATQPPPSICEGPRASSRQSDPCGNKCHFLAEVLKKQVCSPPLFSQ